jgi:hypothetical protein
MSLFIIFSRMDLSHFSRRSSKSRLLTKHYKKNTIPPHLPSTNFHDECRLSHDFFFCFCIIILFSASFLVISDYFLFLHYHVFIFLSSPNFTVGNELVLYPFLLDLYRTTSVVNEVRRDRECDVSGQKGAALLYLALFSDWHGKLLDARHVTAWLHRCLRSRVSSWLVAPASCMRSAWCCTRPLTWIRIVSI